MANDESDLYRWLHLLVVLASSSSRDLLGDLLGDDIDVDALRPIARQLVDKYLSEDSDYDWTDDAVESGRIQEEIARHLSALQLKRGREELRQFDDDQKDAGWDWTHVLARVARRREVVMSGELRATIDEFLGSAPADIPAGARDDWDEGWVIVGHPWDAETIATTFRITRGARLLRERITTSRDRDGRDALVRTLSEMLDGPELHAGLHPQVRQLIALLAAEPIDT